MLRLRPRTNSLSFRLFVLAAVWSLLALAVAGAFLLADHRMRVDRGHEAFLDLLLLNVIATTDIAEDGSLLGAPQAGDGRFLSLHSGWYWQVSRIDEADGAMTSPSLAGERLVLPSRDEAPFDSEFRRVTEIAGPENSRLKAIERLVLLGEEAAEFSFVAAGDLSVPETTISEFRTRLTAVFAVLGVGLVVITVAQVRFGLRPLRRVGRAVTAIREGRADRLDNDYPEEIAPLSHEINALIESNAQIVERARMHVGNLAHALKTPLSVITNEARAAEGPLADKVAEQAAVMRHQLDYYLDRARMVAGAGAIGTVTELRPVIEPLERAMRRIYAERDVTLIVSLDDGLTFQGERQDLEEMIGNLVDNAFKWARSHVQVTCLLASEAPKRLEIVVDDDGPGLTPDQRAEAMRRGRRLDETKPGSGLGLSIVSELAALYQGEFELGEAPGGGLRARLRLPAA